LDCQNNYIRRSSVNDEKNFGILAISSNVLYNYSNGSNKIIFKSISIAHFLDTSAKRSFRIFLSLFLPFSLFL